MSMPLCATKRNHLAAQLQSTSYFFLEFTNEMFQQSVVEIFATQECVTIGRAYFEHVGLHLQNGDIEGTAAEIVHGNTRHTDRHGEVRVARRVLTFYHSISPSRRRVQPLSVR